MSPLSVAFLWHMHQPYYADPVARTALLPWVRLHCTRSYYDMVSLLEDFPEVRATFNLVPSLLLQIEQYNEGKLDDFYREVTRIPATDLEVHHKIFLLSSFFSANWETMIDPYPRYRELLGRRGRHPEANEVESRLGEFSTRDYRDLQVWFNLTWMGFRARNRIPEVRALIDKGEGFSEEDKRLLLEAQDRILREVIPLYRKLSEAGRIELSTSPFYHPILPLLIDTECARRALPNLLLPESFRHPQDAQGQIRRSLEFHARLFGRPPRGIWPSEGSVSPELIPILADAGVQWTATDEEILIHSLGGDYRSESLYQPYRVGRQGREVSILFRDKTLSNLISFSYSRRSPAEAAADLCNHLRAIQARTGDSGLCTIILDGENPWEYYPGGGEEFLRRTYGFLSGSMKSTTIGAYLEEHPPRERIAQLFTGSWINHNFDIWIGSPEENSAWELLSQTREEIDRLLPSGSEGQLSEAWEEIYRAEGSDWFWWFGDDFHSDQKTDFDRLFRLHLQNAYRLAGTEPPVALLVPVLRREAVALDRAHSAFISPVINGDETHFYEWRGAVRFDPVTASGTMAAGSIAIKALYYGQDRENLYLRFDPHLPFASERNRGLQMILRFLDPPDYSLVVALDRPGPQRCTVERDQDRENAETERAEARAVLGEIGELALPLQALGARVGDTLRFVVHLRRGSSPLETFPFQGVFSLSLQPENERIWWGF